MIIGSSAAAAIDSMFGFLGGPLFRSSFAPFKDVSGEYKHETSPLDKPVKIFYINKRLDLIICKTNHNTYLVDLWVPDHPYWIRVHFYFPLDVQILSAQE